jgi:pyruvate dehydrogenase E1 component beta subunit
VTGYDTIMPLLKLESYYLPGVDQICRTVKETMEFA